MIGRSDPEGDAMAETMARAHAPERQRSEQLLRLTAVIFAVAVLAHGADHVRRGIDASTEVVRGAGGLQFLAGAVAVVLVFRGHRSAAAAWAAYVGLISAAGFAAAHLLPHWSAFSDPYTGGAVAPHVTTFSWFTALFEIAADIAFGVAGLRVLRER
jgi:hypothetical protein